MEVSKRDIYEYDFSVSHNKSYQSDSVSIHFHEDIEIFFLIKGGKTCLIGNEFYDINPHDILIFKPNQIHKIIRDENELYERYIIVAKPHFLQELLTPEELYALHRMLNSCEAIIFSLTGDDSENLLELLNNYSNGSGLFNHALRKAKFTEILVLVFTLLQKHGIVNKRSINQNPQISPILEYIENNFTNTSLTMLAQHFNLNKNYLCALFKKNTSMTVNEYLLNKKITYAKRLLADGLNVTETSNLCGFNDFSNFIRVFKKYTGISPKKYQLNLNNF